ncbi:MAG: rhamnogalacturonan acetylesterase [Bacteroidales bacterium]|nr:rhamnogalacturonan acetylesterase [Bacteroidales bacterium]
MKKAKILLLALSVAFVCLDAAAAGFPIIYTYDTSKPQQHFELNVPVPDGNYLVTLEIGSRRFAARTFVKSESRRLSVNDLATAKGEVKTVSFLVNKRERTIVENGEAVAQVITKPREKFKLDWDDSLNLEIDGDAPAVASVRIEPAPAGTVTVFLCGDSTVVDQDIEPWASWGQMFPWFLDTQVAVANYAESGERADSFIGAGRLRKILSVMQPGDYVFVEFGHNDMKLQGPGKGGYYFFATQLKTFIDEVRAKGGYPVLVSPTHRRNFDADGHIIETHADFPEAMEWVAGREGVPFIDLHRLSAVFYEAMGEEASKRAFVHYKAGSFEGMPADVEDNTHFNTYGAFELAKCVAAALRVSGLDLAKHLVNGEGFTPTCPDAPESFRWPLSPWRDTYGVQVSEKDDHATVVK